MSGGALHSDHINYLILRYLQEHGHENAALAFHKDWHRPYEFRDPEALPFAPIVKRDALISVVQDGLYFDHLASRSQKANRKFRWAGISPREQLSEEDLAALEDGGLANERPPSSGKRKGRQQPVMRAPDEFPTPAPKRQRRSEGSDRVHLNGDRDAMEVDDVSPSADPDEDAEGEVVSLDAASEVDVVEVPERYDSMDVATQTEVKTGPKTSVLYWKIDKPGATVLHSSWNPHSDPKHANTLLTVGESLCRIYDIPESMGNMQQITHPDDPYLLPNATVTASAWHPDGHTAACAMQQDTSDDQTKQLSLILNHGREYGSTIWDAEASMLDPPNVVLCMQYSPKGAYLLVLRTSSRRSLVQVWAVSPPTASHEEALTNARPVAWKLFEQQVLDACWSADDAFVVCGTDGLAGVYRLDLVHNIADTYDEDTMEQKGLRDELDLNLARETWNKIRFDESLGVAAFVSTEARLVRLVRPRVKNVAVTVRKQDVLHLPGELTALAFRPNPSPDGSVAAADPGKQQESSLLAATLSEGFCTLYRVSQAGTEGPYGEKLITLEFDNSPALALAWSPQGTHLAFGSTDLVHVYAAESSFLRTEGERQKPLVDWRPDATAIGKRKNGEHAKALEAEAADSEPSLSWSADGESLCFAHDQQLAVIRFRPPLHVAPSEQPEVNGGASP